MNVEKKRTNIFITGATGFLGSHLVVGLKRKRLDFKCLVRRNSDISLLKKLKIKFVYGNLGDKNNLKNILKDMNIVIHLAGIINSSSKNLYHDINFSGTKNLIEACKKNNVRRFIHISTQDVDFTKGLYSISKLQGEEVVKGSELNFTIFRPTMIYGEGSCDLKDLINLIKKTYIVPIVGSGKNKFQPVYVGDIVKAIIKSIGNEKTIGKTYYLGGADKITYNNLIDLIIKRLQLKRIRIHLPIIFMKSIVWIYEKIVTNPSFTVDKIVLLTYDKTCDISLAEKDLRFKPIGIRNGIKHFIT